MLGSWTMNLSGRSLLAAIAAAAVWTIPVAAYNIAYAQADCRALSRSENFRAISCGGTERSAGNRAYERWQDGTPATGVSAAQPNAFPQYFRGYNSLYGFGR